MSSILTIEGKEYVTAATAGKYFEYTKDYMLLLIKQGKIDGQKVGNKWYVHIPSAEVFFKNAKQKRSERRVEVSQIRKAELRQHTKIRKAPHRRTALIETFAVFAIAVTIGMTGYVGSIAQVSAVGGSDVGFLENLAVSLYTYISPDSVATETGPEIQSEPVVTEVAPIEVVSAHVGTTTHTSLVVAPNELFTATTIESVKESFSDEVEVSVDPHDPSTGIITPIFKDSKGEEYRFLMVPVKTDSP